MTRPRSLSNAPSIGATLAALLSLAGAADAQIELSQSTIQGGGGATLTGGTFSLRGTSGAHDATAGLSGGTIAHDGGFWPGVCSGHIIQYGVGCPGSGGFVPSLQVEGCPSTADLETFKISQCLGGSQAFFMVGFGQGATPIGGGCLLNIAAPLPTVFGPYPLFGAGPGAGALTFTLPILPTQTVASTVGLAFAHQVFVVDPAGVLGFVGSNGVETKFG